MHPRTVITGDYRIMSLLCGLAGHHKKRYVYPSQEWLLGKLEQFYGRDMSRSTLCRHMAALERDGYLKRTRRISRHPTKGMLFRSTLYQITRKTIRFATYMTGIVRFFGPKHPGKETPMPCVSHDTLSNPLSKDCRGGFDTAPLKPDIKPSYGAVFDNLRRLKAAIHQD